MSLRVLDLSVRPALSIADVMPHGHADIAYSLLSSRVWLFRALLIWGRR